MSIKVVNDSVINEALSTEIDGINSEENDDITKHSLKCLSIHELFTSTKTDDLYNTHNESNISPTINDGVSKMNILKGFIISLEDQIKELKDEIIFLRNDANNKSDIIKNLLTISKQTINHELISNKNGKEASDNLQWNNKDKDRKFYDGRQHSLCTNILDELMTTPKKNHDSKQHSYHSFPTFNENLATADNIYGIEINKKNEKEEEMTENNEQLTSSINITSHFSIQSDTPTHEISTESSENQRNAKRYEWEKYSSGFATKMLDKMGYQGKGLGKAENGIVETIEAVKKSNFNGECKINSKSERNLVYILSDSMLNQINEKKLYDKYEVKVMCHGGCTIECIYSHIPEVIKRNPKYLVLHIGTNNSKEMTSDEVLCQLTKLKKFIEMVLPNTTVIISQPTVRTDDSRANQIIINLNTKLRRTNYILMDNSNIQASHLGKRGLHFNSHGTKLMAININYLLRRL